MSIKAIIFDADGVAIFPWRAAQLFEREYGITREMVSEFFSGIFADCLIGKADLKEELPPYLERWGWQTSVDGARASGWNAEVYSEFKDFEAQLASYLGDG